MWTVDDRVETRTNNDVDLKTPLTSRELRVGRARRRPQVLKNDYEYLVRKRR